ncbi:MAG: MOSC domain-containing protein, partial [Planctomycetaceae bacterium]
MAELRDLVETFPHAGRVEWIGVAAARLADIESLETVRLEPGDGIEGEHHANGGNSHRQVTLIQQEHLPVVAGLLNRESVQPEQLRRNVVVSGINLSALKRGRFRIGDALLDPTVERVHAP